MAQPNPPVWHKDVLLKDGTTLRLRPLRGEDRERMLSFYDRLSPTTVYNRFMGFVARPSFKQAERIAELDYGRARRPTHVWSSLSSIYLRAD